MRWLSISFVLVLEICTSSSIFAAEIGCQFMKLAPFQSLRSVPGHDCPSVEQVLKEFERRYPFQDPDLAESSEERKLALDALSVATAIKSEVVKALVNQGTQKIFKPLDEFTHSSDISEESLSHIFRRVRLDFSYDETEMYRGLAFLIRHEMGVAANWGPGYSGLNLLIPELSSLVSRTASHPLLGKYIWLQASIGQFLGNLDHLKVLSNDVPAILFTPKIALGEKERASSQIRRLKDIIEDLDAGRACEGPQDLNEKVGLSRTAFLLHQVLNEAAEGQAGLVSQMAQIRGLADRNDRDLMAHATGLFTDDADLVRSQLDFEYRRFLRLSHRPRDLSPFLIRRFHLDGSRSFDFESVLADLNKRLCAAID